MQKALLNSLVYLDKDFIADSYEIWSGDNAASTLTKHHGEKAGASMLPFSADVSAQESRTYPVSTLQMLAQLWTHLAEQPAVNVGEFAERSASEFGWVQGQLSTFQVRSKTQKDGLDVVQPQSSHFQLRGIEQGRYVNLITTPDYFASGFNALLPLQMTLLNKFTLPVCIYMRLLPAKDHAENWVAVPLLIVESRPTLTRDIQALF